MRTLAVDLDNTLLTYDGWKGEQHFGEPVAYAREALTLLRGAGWKIIVWTCRQNVSLVQTVCDKYFPDLIHAINTNPEFDENGDYRRKIVADVYLDDRAWPLCGQEVNWVDVINDFERRGWLEPLSKTEPSHVA